jgi:hypothetical protein
VVAADGPAFEQLRALLSDRFEVTALPEQRMLSVAAPDETADLARVAGSVRDSGIAVDEIALRRPTLDDAFLALTGHGVAAGDRPGAEVAS